MNLNDQPAQGSREPLFNTWLLGIMQVENQNRRLAVLARIFMKASTCPRPQAGRNCLPARGSTDWWGLAHFFLALSRFLPRRDA